MKRLLHGVAWNLATYIVVLLITDMPILAAIAGAISYVIGVHEYDRRNVASKETQP